MSPYHPPIITQMGHLRRACHSVWEGKGCFLEEVMPELNHGRVISEQFTGGGEGCVVQAQVSGWRRCSQLKE